MTSEETAGRADLAPMWLVRRWGQQLTAAKARAWHAHPRIALGAVFVLVWLAAAVIYYWRFPNNLHYPNFYAEDGYVFAHNLLAHGFWASLFITFNGYYVWGIYLVEKAGFVVSSMLYGGQLVNAPKGLALASYGFLGLVAALPIVLLKPYLNLAWRLVAALVLVLTPMLGFDYAIIGTTGNLKFAFVPVAFMLLAYRLRLPRSSRQIPLVDLGLLVCAYTDATVYFMLPVMLWCDGLRPKQLWQWRTVVRRDNWSLWSALGLGVLLLLQIAVVAKYGIPPMPGYLDGPLQKRQLPEIVMTRSYLFPLVYWFYRSLRNAVAAVLLAGVLWLMWRYGRKDSRPLYGLAVVTVLFGTLLFVANRPGVTGLFHHYGDAGPDQFFYGQNMVFALALVVLVAEMIRRLAANWRHLAPAAVAVLVVLPAGQAGSWGAHDFMQNKVGTVKANALKACRGTGQDVTVTVYPSTSKTFTATRAQWCTAATLAYRPDEVNLGLVKDNNHYVPLDEPGQVRQVFRSPRNDLSGIGVYFSTFGRATESRYELVLYDANCRQQLRTVTLPRAIADNTTAKLRFAPFAHSAGQNYCFSVLLERTTSKPLAVQLTAEGAYPAGKLYLNGKADQHSLVFSLLYPNLN